MKLLLLIVLLLVGCERQTTSATAPMQPLRKASEGRRWIGDILNHLPLAEHPPDESRLTLLLYKPASWLIADDIALALYRDETTGELWVSQSGGFAGATFWFGPDDGRLWDEPMDGVAPYNAPLMRWFISDIADAVAAGLQARARADDLEQVVYGFDHLDELGLHPLIHTALREAGWAVWPEQRYPGDMLKPKRSEGKRCDVVIGHDPALPGLRDPLVRDTLFDLLPAADPEQTYWLEIKTVAQYETSGPFRRYSAELLATVAEDVKKIWSDTVIRHGGLLLVLFSECAEVAENDLAAWHRKCLERGYPVGPPATRGFAITDRIGNGWCSVAVFGVRGV